MPIVPPVLPADPPPLRERLAWVARFRRLVGLHERDLCGLMGAELAKPRFEAFASDVLPLLAACRFVERRAPKVLRARRAPGTPLWLPGSRVEVRRVPLGDVAIIATWNYPVQLLGVQLVHALAAGNRVTAKPSERVPRTQARLLELALEAHPGEGSLAWTHATREEGERLLASRRFDHVVFTGSTEVGREVASRAAGALTPCTLELTGRDSAFVLEDADASLAAASLLGALAMNAGQTCIAPRRVFVHERVHDRFAEALDRLVTGSPAREVIDAGAADLCRRVIADAIARGARLAGASADPAGPALRPVFLLDCPPDALAAHGRLFGPVCAVIRVASIDQALAMHGAIDQHLSAAIFTRDRRAADALAPRLNASLVCVNDCVLPLAHPGCSLAGNGASGMGVTRGEAGLLAMTRPVCVTRGRALARASLRALSPAATERVIGVLTRLYAGRPPRPPSARADRPSPARSAPA